jgi:hypothetical protein
LFVEYLISTAEVTTGVQVLGAMSRSKSNAILKMKGLL